MAISVNIYFKSKSINRDKEGTFHNYKKDNSSGRPSNYKWIGI